MTTSEKSNPGLPEDRVEVLQAPHVALPESHDKQPGAADRGGCSGAGDDRHATPAMTVLYSDVDKAERLAVGRKAFGRWLGVDACVPGVTGNTRTAVVTPATTTSEKE